MRRLLSSLLIAAILPTAAMAAKPDAYLGRWIAPCGHGTYCRILIEPARQPNHMTFTFLITKPGNKPSQDCEWHVDMLYTKENGFPSYIEGQQFQFYAVARRDGTLHTSGIMPATCGTRPQEGFFDPDPDDGGDE